MIAEDWKLRANAMPLGGGMTCQLGFKGQGSDLFLIWMVDSCDFIC